MIDRINNFRSELTGHHDGTSQTRSWTKVAEHRDWAKTAEGFSEYVESSYIFNPTTTRSEYYSNNTGVHKRDDDGDHQVWMTNGSRTNFLDVRKTTFDSNGNGRIVHITKDGILTIIENWLGQDFVTSTEDYGGRKIIPSGAVSVHRTEIQRDQWGNEQVFPSSIPSTPNDPFYIEKLKTFDFHIKGDVQFVEYTSYRSNMTTGTFTAVGGALGIVIGIVGSPFSGGTTLFLSAVALDTMIGGLRTAMTGRQKGTLMGMIAGGAYEWALQTSTNNSDFELTDEEKEAAGAIADFVITLGFSAAAKVGKAVSQLRLAGQIFRQTAGACDEITKVGRAMRSFREAGDVLAGKSTVQSSVRNILDNYCFVGTVDVSAYSTENRWADVVATPHSPLAATPALLRSEGAAGWIVIGAGAVALLQVFSGHAGKRRSEEQEETYPELAWA